LNEGEDAKRAGTLFFERWSYEHAKLSAQEKRI